MNLTHYKEIKSYSISLHTKRRTIMAEVHKFICAMILLSSLLFVATKVCGGGKSLFHHFQISFFPSYVVDNLLYIMF
jgi:hypothetical protein